MSYIESMANSSSFKQNSLVPSADSVRE